MLLVARGAGFAVGTGAGGAAGAAGSDEQAVAKASRQAQAAATTRMSALRRIFSGTSAGLSAFPFPLAASTRLAAEDLICRALLKDVAATPVRAADEPVGINLEVFWCVDVFG